jgi:hypothetical protein
MPANQVTTPNRQLSIAVVDLGSARTKIYLVSVQGNRITTTQIGKHELDLARALRSDEPTEHAALGSILRQCKRTAMNAGATQLVAIATQAARVSGRADVLRDQSGAAGIEVGLLGSDAEGALLLSALENNGEISSEWAAVDIGGGSVQWAWRSPTGEAIVRSAPVGTFALEHAFQAGSPATAAELEMMRLHVHAQFEECLPDKPAFAGLVFGTSCMAAFFGSALAAVGRGPTRIDEAGPRYNLDAALALESSLAGRPYDELGEYFPENPKFMYGADKLLVAAAREFRGTNLSLAAGIGLLAATRSEGLRDFGLTVSRI